MSSTLQLLERGTVALVAIDEAHCVSLWVHDFRYGLADVVQQRRMIDSSEGDAAHRRRLGQHLDAMLALCETVECRRAQLLAYFGQDSTPCGSNPKVRRKFLSAR